MNTDKAEHVVLGGLLVIFGSRSVASAVLGGKRELSEAHIRKLAEFFHVSPELFSEEQGAT
jgi:antitoxin component HigA of HigAB toxin-antitoxin module